MPCADRIVHGIVRRAALGSLRDDVVFFIFLYQRWLYPVDKKRANEFGIAYEH